MISTADYNLTSMVVDSYKFYWFGVFFKIFFYDSLTIVLNIIFRMCDIRSKVLYTN